MGKSITVYEQLQLLLAVLDEANHERDEVRTERDELEAEIKVTVKRLIAELEAERDTARAELAALKKGAEDDEKKR